MKPRSKLRDRLVLPLLSTISRRPIVHFLHVGKTGGTALRSALNIGRRKNFTTTGSHILLFHDHSVRLSDVPRGHRVVFGVRHSADRFMSAFYSRLRHGRFGTNTWKAEEQVAFERFKSPNDLAASLMSDDVHLRRAAEKAMNSIIHVKANLSYWLGDVEALRARRRDILYIYRQETLSSDFERIKRLLSLPASAQLPSDPILAHRMPADTDRRFDPIAQQNISNWYAADRPLIDECEAIRAGIATGALAADAPRGTIEVQL